MMIPCLCSFRSSSCDLRHKKIPRPNGLAASFLVDIPTRWEPRTNQSNGLRLLIFPQPLVRALKNQNAAPTTPPCFCRRQRSSSLHWGFDCLRCARHVLSSSCDLRHKKIPRPNGLAASFLVDIPTRWKPRTNQSPARALIAPPAARPCCSSPVPSCSDAG